MNNDEKNYTMDAKASLIGNMFWIFICFIAIGFFVVGFNQVSTFENETNHLLGIIIISLATIRIFTWNGMPRIYLKVRDKR